MSGTKNNVESKLCPFLTRSKADRIQLIHNRSWMAGSFSPTLVSEDDLQDVFNVRNIKWQQPGWVAQSVGHLFTARTKRSKSYHSAWKWSQKRLGSRPHWVFPIPSNLVQKLNRFLRVNPLWLRPHFRIHRSRVCPHPHGAHFTRSIWSIVPLESKLLLQPHPFPGVCCLGIQWNYGPVSLY